MLLLTLELMIVLLALGCVGLFWWAHSLYRQRQQTVLVQSAASEPLSPLVHAVASTFDSGLIVLDSERQARYLNPQAYELLHLENINIIGEGLITIVRDYQVDALVSDVLRDREPREMMVQQQVAGRTLRVRASAFENKDQIGAVLIIRDVTQINMLERARRDMVANVSHELRTPLASIKLLVETVQSSPPPAVTQRMLSQMAHEVDAVTQLVDELHELSQIESGRVALQFIPTPLAPVAARAIERIRPQAERKQIGLTIEVSESLPDVLIDEQRIGQVLLNLLHNAVKFTPEHGTITLRAALIAVVAGVPTGYFERRLSTQPVARERRNKTVLRQRQLQVRLPQPISAGDWLLVSVVDSGVGIPQRDLPRIFERFYKVDRARTRNRSGTGLGLAIAKHLVEGHGGKIWASSVEGQGSTFYFVLPVADM